MVGLTKRTQFHTQRRIKHFEPKEADSCKSVLLAKLIW